MRKFMCLPIALTLATLLPLPAIAQQPPVHREGSWELSLGGGVMLLDQKLRDYLGSRPANERFANSATPDGLAPTLVARLGHNFSRHFGISVSGGAARAEGVTYLTPTMAMTLTGNLNARTSPFLIVGTGFTRISGLNERVTHSTWGLHAGLGVRQMLGDRMALRLEGRIQAESYDMDNDPGVRSRTTVYNPVITLGLSSFIGGRQPQTMAAAMPSSCPACPRQVTRVDTVRVSVPAATRAPAAIVLRDTLVLEGVNFAFDESALTAESHEVLNRVAAALQESQWANVRFEVAGHTSMVGTESYNMSLSQRRAEAVRAYLVSRGVANDRMVARGYGQTQPIFREGTEGDAWQNRRVELRRMR
ncbi:MAG: OmpA family protein [Gemmatimonadales bacterium]